MHLALSSPHSLSRNCALPTWQRTFPFIYLCLSTAPFSVNYVLSPLFSGSFSVVDIELVLVLRCDSPTENCDPNVPVKRPRKQQLLPVHEESTWKYKDMKTDFFSMNKTLEKKKLRMNLKYLIAMPVFKHLHNNFMKTLLLWNKFKISTFSPFSPLSLSSSCAPGRSSSPDSHHLVSLGSLLDDQHWHHVAVEHHSTHLNLTVDKSTLWVQIPPTFTHWDHSQVCFCLSRCGIPLQSHLLKLYFFKYLSLCFPPYRWVWEQSRASALGGQSGQTEISTAVWKTWFTTAWTW